MLAVLLYMEATGIEPKSVPALQDPARRNAEPALMDYATFIDSKTHLGSDDGFDPLWIPDKLFDFQKHLVEWALRKGRAAIFADCGLGKSFCLLTWAENVVRKTNGRVLVITPLAVAYQTIEEGAKLGVEVRRSIDGTPFDGITVTNYERLHKFDAADFAGVVCDESSAIKCQDGKHRQEVTDFARKLRYRLLCTATAAPNDYIELGTSSEALGQLGYADMLSRFFKNDQHNTVKAMRSIQTVEGHQVRREPAKWRLKGHAEDHFWRWVCSWARAMRRPSDFGFDDTRFVLPKLEEREHIVKARSLPSGMLFDLPPSGLREERDEQRRTVGERCERAAALVNGTSKQAILWCHLNVEGDTLEKLIPNAIQISGKDSDDDKEEKLMGFVRGKTRVLITKPKIGAWGLNLQMCAHVVYFPSYSFESYYQAVRRCWRFGQTKPVVVDIVTTETGIAIQRSLQRKARQADVMFTQLVHHMNDAMVIAKRDDFNTKMEIPKWL